MSLYPYVAYVDAVNERITTDRHSSNNPHKLEKMNSVGMALNKMSTPLAISAAVNIFTETQCYS